jgi:uncharacterized RDD family membrane protein YckC
MTQSDTPHGDKAELEQEEIWVAPLGADASSMEAASPGPDHDERDGAPSGLTRNITSTARMPGPAGFYYADVPNRIIALIIDVIVLAVLGFFLALLFGGLVTDSGALDSAGGELDLLPFLIVMVLQAGISFVYFGYLWVAARGTVGMKLLGLQIGDEGDGHSIGWRQALIRWLIIGIPSLLASLSSYVPSLIGIALSVVGVAWLLVLLYSVAQSPTKQGLHDRYARTIMVKEGRRVA